MDRTNRLTEKIINRQSILAPTVTLDTSNVIFIETSLHSNLYFTGLVKV